MQRRGIGVSNLPNLIHNKYTDKGCTFNIMAAGSHGLGKTTFLNQFLGTKILELNPFKPRDNNLFWHIENVCNIQTSYVEILESDLVIRMNITEVDGIGDCIDNTNCWVPIVDFLEKNFEDYHNKFKKSVASQIEDKRVHLCLYFLEPISIIKNSDIEVLKKISKYCTVIPIIAKADLISPSKVSEIKAVLRDILTYNNINYFEDAENMIKAPFFIFNQERGSDFGYTWCTSPLQNSKINDFLILKRLILENCVNVIKKETNNYYDNYRVLKLLFKNDDEGRRQLFEKKIEEYQSKINLLQEKIRQKALQKSNKSELIGESIE